MIEPCLFKSIDKKEAKGLPVQLVLSAYGQEGTMSSISQPLVDEVGLHSQLCDRDQSRLFKSEFPVVLWDKPGFTTEPSLDTSSFAGLSAAFFQDTPGCGIRSGTKQKVRPGDSRCSDLLPCEVLLHTLLYGTIAKR